jgi:glycyl-tRNA synthetase beta subunit
MEDDLDLRHNRLALLQSIISTFADIIDFTKIVQPGQ